MGTPQWTLPQRGQGSSYGTLQLLQNKLWSWPDPGFLFLDVRTSTNTSAFMTSSSIRPSVAVEGVGRIT